MASITDYGAAADPLSAPSLSEWAEAVADVLDSSDLPVSDRFATVGHDHDFATPGHDHDADYAAVGHGHTGMVTSTDVDTIEVVTQAAYDALTPDASTLYIIVG